MKLVSVLLVDDDYEICKEFENYINTRKGVKLIATTNSSYEAIDIVKNKNPVVIILDIQLPNGSGSGYSFLSEIHTLNLPYSPIIAVNTNIKNSRMYKKLNNEWVDFIFYKNQKGYSVKSVIDDILFLSQDAITNDTSQEQPIIKEIFQDLDKRIDTAIKSELDDLRINYDLKGSDYLIDCLNALLKEKVNPNYSVLQYVAKKYTVCSNSIGRGIQTLINDTWKKSSLDHLQEKYKARIDYNTGVPTPTEFIYYYYKKIKDSLLL